MFRVKLCSWEGFLGGISPLPELSSQEINICTTQGEEKHSKDLSPLILKQKTCHSNCDRPGRSNRHGYCDLTGD